MNHSGVVFMRAEPPRVLSSLAMWLASSFAFMAALGLPLPGYALFALLQRRREKLAADPRRQLRSARGSAAASAACR